MESNTSVPLEADSRSGDSRFSRATPGPQKSLCAHLKSVQVMNANLPPNSVTHKDHCSVVLATRGRTWWVGSSGPKLVSTRPKWVSVFALVKSHSYPAARTWATWAPWLPFFVCRCSLQHGGFSSWTGYMSAPGLREREKVEAVSPFTASPESLVSPTLHYWTRRLQGACSTVEATQSSPLSGEA